MGRHTLGPGEPTPWQQLGEFGLIERLNAILPTEGPGVLQAAGDDAAVVDAGDGNVWLLTTDLMVEERHFRRAYPPQAVGHRLLAANLSDIAAMGGRPSYALVNLALPHDLPADYVDALAGGMADLARRHEVAVIGGDTSASPKGLFLAVTAVGTSPGDHVKYRRDARPGDLIFVTGTLGRSRLGLAALEHADPSEPDAASDLSAEGSAALDAARNHHLYPEPQVEAGALLGALPGVGALIDISDGLSSELQHIARSSKVSLSIDTSLLPLIPGFGRAAGALGVDPLAAALHGGEEFELLGTVRRAAWDAVQERLAAVAIGVSRIGVVREGKAQVWMHAGDEMEEPLEPSGWRHF